MRAKFTLTLTAAAAAATSILFGLVPGAAAQTTTSSTTTSTTSTTSTSTTLVDLPTSTTTSTTSTTAPPTTTTTTAMPSNACATGAWPAAVVGQTASFRAGAASGVYLWHDRKGWHLRVTHPGSNKVTFSGVVRSNRPIRDHAVKNEKNDKLRGGRDRRSFSFVFRNYGKIDGVDWRSPCASSMWLDLSRDGARMAVADIYLGAQGAHPDANPVYLTRPLTSPTTTSTTSTTTAKQGRKAAERERRRQEQERKRQERERAQAERDARE
ncbi:MAG: hypothetical protein JF603_07575 [Acidobacteria bacterium]|nr:hypothetical protein [Acidobacteriota bacterium]